MTQVGKSFCPGILRGPSFKNLVMISCALFKSQISTYNQAQEACTILGDLRTYGSLVEPK